MRRGREKRDRPVVADVGTAAAAAMVVAEIAVSAEISKHHNHVRRTAAVRPTGRALFTDEQCQFQIAFGR